MNDIVHHLCQAWLLRLAWFGCCAAALSPCTCHPVLAYRRGPGWDRKLNLGMIVALGAIASVLADFVW